MAGDAVLCHLVAAVLTRKLHLVDDAVETGRRQEELEVVGQEVQRLRTRCHGLDAGKSAAGHIIEMKTVEDGIYRAGLQVQWKNARRRSENRSVLFQIL